MKRPRTGITRKRTKLAQALVIGAALFALAPAARALDTQDIVIEWTEEGKKLAQERVAKWKTKEEMVLIPAGEFLMGSDKKTDRLAYRSEIPQRSVYLDAFMIGKYEVTALEYLKFVLATDRLPQLDWRYDGGNFQDTMAHHPIMPVNWYDADAYCKWAASGCRRRRSGRRRRVEWMADCSRGAANMPVRPGRISAEPDCPGRCGIVLSACCSIHRSFPSIGTTMP